MMINIMEEEKKKFSPQAEIEIIPDGPVKITGNVILRDVKRDIMETSANEIYLCRCGRSKSKPFCDGSHEG
ncbi:MAG: CDGSH iron-sulfur domain-containing protein [Bacteroidales bacterium]